MPNLWTEWRERIVRLGYEDGKPLIVTRRKHLACRVCENWKRNDQGHRGKGWCRVHNRTIGQFGYCDQIRVDADIAATLPNEIT